jgi:hypothetical protein
MSGIQGNGSRWEQLNVQGDRLMDKVKELIHQGNVSHLIIKHEGNTVLEIPVTVGLVATVLAPALAAVGAVGALLTNCTIDVIRTEPDGGEQRTDTGNLFSSETPSGDLS